MKRLIASDLHGSARFCRQLLERYQQEGAQQLILLGDLVYSGSYAPQYEYDPHQVIQLLRRKPQGKFAQILGDILGELILSHLQPL